MTVDYLDAHKRHFEDAETLFARSRWANADHLYGMAAECGLKCLMLLFDMKLDGNRPADGKDKKHINGIWDRYETYRSGHADGAAYGLPSTNPFRDWTVDQRYAHQRDFDATRATKHGDAARQVRLLVNTAITNGLIR